MESLRPRRLSEILDILWRKKQLLVLMSAAMLCATFVVIRRIPSKYESTSTVVVGKQASDDQRVQYAPRFSALVDQISSRDNYTGIIRKLNLYPEIERMEAKILAFQKDLKDPKQAIKIRDYYPTVPESIKLSFRYRDPVKAQQTIQELTNGFILANNSLKQESAEEVQRLNAQIAEVAEQLQRLGPKKDLQAQRFESLLNRTDPAVAMAQLQSRQITEQSLETLRDDKFRIEAAITQKKSEIEDQQKIVKQAATIPSTSVSTAMGTLIGKKADIEAEINANTAKGFTAKHPEMKALAARLAQVELQISRLESSPQTSGDSNRILLPEYKELRKLQGELATLEANLESTNRKLNAKTEAYLRMPTPSAPTSPQRLGNPVEDAAAVTAYDKLLTQYEWLLNKQDETLRIANAQENSVMMYQVVEKPNLPQFPVAPNRMMLQILALALAMGFGLLAAFGSELPKFFFINGERDIEYYLGAPVLAAIPETLTPIERSHKRKLKMTRSLLLLVLVGALVPAFILVLNATKIFHFLGNK
jgi:capsular polysaccharide biosynthesis protein